MSMKGLSASATRVGTACTVRCAVDVRASKRTEELKELREMSSEAIEKAVVDLKGELFLLRAKRATRLEFKPSDFGRINKKVRC